MAWAIIKIYTSKCAQMDPQQLPKTSKFYSRSKKCDIKKTLGGWVPPPLGSPKVNMAWPFNNFVLHKDKHLIQQILSMLSIAIDRKTGQDCHIWCIETFSSVHKKLHQSAWGINYL